MRTVNRILLMPMSNLSTSIIYNSSFKMNAAWLIAYKFVQYTPFTFIASISDNQKNVDKEGSPKYVLWKLSDIDHFAYYTMAPPITSHCPHTIIIQNPSTFVWSKSLLLFSFPHIWAPGTPLQLR